MTSHLARSRITKAFTDADLVASFGEAESRLDRISPCVMVGRRAASTAAGQTAALTALVTAKKCFGRAHLCGEGLELALHQPLLAGATLASAALALGANVSVSIPPSATHLVRIGNEYPWSGWQVSLWWDRWLSGTRLWPTDFGSSSLPLAGMFAGALAVRQIFAHLLRGTPAREESISIWEPDRVAVPGERGPKRCTIPASLWLVGLGHLGQAFVWGLLSLPRSGERHVILQDDQRIGIENEPTSLLVRDGDIGRRKVRVAAEWLDHGGWSTELLERRHRGDIQRMPQDPTILLAGLDDVEPRRTLARAGFDYMIDAGIGRGPRDFESLQVRAIAKGDSVESLWLQEETSSRREMLMDKSAYRAFQKDAGPCGIVPLADASVSVPFVGAATAALTLAQLARLGGMVQPAALLQVELGAPAMVIDGGRAKAPNAFAGGTPFDLD